MLSTVSLKVLLFLVSILGVQLIQEGVLFKKVVISRAFGNPIDFEPPLSAPCSYLRIKDLGRFKAMKDLRFVKLSQSTDLSMNQFSTGLVPKSTS